MTSFQPTPQGKPTQMSPIRAADPIAVAVLAGLVSIWVLASTVPAIADPHSYSLPVRRLAGFLASGLDASLIPVIAYLLGIFAWVLDR